MSCICMFLAYCLGNSSAAVVPGGAAAGEVLEGLCEGEDGLCVGLAIEKVRVEGWRDGMGRAQRVFNNVHT